MFSYAALEAVFLFIEAYWAPIRYSLIANLYVDSIVCENGIQCFPMQLQSPFLRLQKRIGLLFAIR